MAKFRGTVCGFKSDGSRTTEDSKLGATGIETNANAWDLGVQVYGTLADGQEEFEVWITGGSNKSSKRRLIGTLTQGGFLHANPTSR